MSKPVLPFIEIMVTQACNLSCTGCTNYSDLKHAGYVTWAQGQKQLEAWLTRVDIPDFGILGGEPLMNPYIREWIIGLRELMPSTQIRFTTNGLLLEKNFDIVDLLHQIGNCVFKIAVHQQDNKLEKVIQRVFDSYQWEPVVEYGVHRFRTNNNLRFHVRRPDTFWKTFQGPYSDMKPHDNNPDEAFAICCQQTCPLMYNGKIYKCSTSGLLKETLKRFDYPNRELWEPHIQQGIGPDCTDSELEKFLNNFGHPAPVCAMCPTTKDTQSRLIHLENVNLK
jgi:sulfatase maturation enzyme AslB (radical SAM superfamily)